MKFSTIQVAALAFGLGVSASPSLARRDYNKNPASEVQPTQVPAYPVGLAVPAGFQHNVKKETTEKAEKSKKAKKANKTQKAKKANKTKKAKNATATKAKKPKAAKATKVPASGGEEGSKEGGDEEAPKEGGDEEAPKEGGDEEAPKEGGDEEAPKKGGNPKAPKETPKEGGNPKAPKETSKEGGNPKAPTPTTPPTTEGGSGGSKGSGGVPAHTGSTALKAAQTIAAGASFDGKMAMYDRGVSCTGQAEGGDSDAVFMIEAGGSLSNVVIGPNQIEGVHCQGGCTITNVWWTAVCEDAFSIKVQEASETTKIIGGGAFGAADKVVQHNGAGTVDISGFTVGSFGKLYRACGNCKTSAERHVIMSDITATDGDMLAGINSNFGDTAKITNSKASGVKDICVTFKGVSSGSEPTKIASGSDGTNCIYGSDVTTA